MTNTTALMEAIRESGFKIGAIADMLGLSHNGLTKKINNVNEFKASEIDKLSKLLNIEDKDAYFFVHECE